MGILKLIKDYIIFEVEDATKNALAPLAPYLRKILTGTVLMLSTVLGIFIGLMFGGVAIFSSLIGNRDWSLAALYTGIIYILASLLLYSIGTKLVKSPK